MKEVVQRTLRRFGYQLLPVPTWSSSRGIVEANGYRLVDYRGASGEVDVAAYRTEQEKGNRAKLQQVWTNEPNLRFLCEWLRQRGTVPQFVICHGTRNGFEQRVFHQALGCEVIGTEISSTASQFPMTLQADFHEVRPEWDGKADLVYSNSLDHAYDPAKALRAWARSVRSGGVIVLEKASDSDPRGVSDLDPFGIALPNLLVFVLQALPDIASIRALVEVPNPRAGASYHQMIVIGIQHRA